MAERKDRLFKALQFLATAGDKGLLTTDIVAMSDEPATQQVLTAYGGVLRDAHTSRWVIKGERTPGGWQEGRVRRWYITPHGRQRALELAEQAAKANRKKLQDRKDLAAIRRRNMAIGQVKSTYVIGKSSVRAREQAVLKLRQAGCTWAEIARVTGVSMPTAMKDFDRAERQWPSPLYPRPLRVQQFGPDSPRLPEISGILAAEAGLTQVQVAGLIRVMWALGMKVTVPNRFRVEQPEEGTG